MKDKPNKIVTTVSQIGNKLHQEVIFEISC